MTYNDLVNAGFSQPASLPRVAGPGRAPGEPGTDAAWAEDRVQFCLGTTAGTA